ncbi:MAG: hypothetical protein RIF41_07850 [Polyangiaceae bacterium]
MTAHRRPDLSSLLDSERWSEACDWTRSALFEAACAPAVVRDLDRTWRGRTDGHFGFSVQAAVVGRPVPDGEDIFAAWDYAKLVGGAVGWLGEVFWCPIAESVNARAYPFVDPVPATGPPSDFPKGCFPFYDVLVKRPFDEFSPRDAYGEWLWCDWCKLWRAFMHDDERGGSAEEPL